MATSKLWYLVELKRRWPGRPCVFAITFVVYCLLTFSTPGYPSSDETSQTTIVYHLNNGVGLSDAGVVVALSKGYLKAEGLDVQIVDGTPARQLTAFVSENSKAFGVASIFDFLRARAAGRPIVAFASAYIRNPTVFYVRSDSGIKSVADFMGKTVAYEGGDPTAIIFDALLAKNQVSKSTIREVAGLLNVSALISRAIDILPGYTGRESYLLDQAGVPIYQINPASFGLHLPGTVYFTNEETLRSNPQIVIKFSRALIRGWEAAFRKDKADLATIAKVLQIYDVDAVSYLLDQQRPLLRPSGRRFAELEPMDFRNALAILLNQRLITDSPRLGPAATNFDILKEVYRTEIKESFAN